MDQATRTLLACLAFQNHEGLPAECAQLPASEWEDVAERASAYDVAPQLYGRLKNNPASLAIPVEAEQILAGVALYHTFRNQGLRRQLAQILGSLRDAGLEVVVLKGNHLVELIYTDVNLRLIGDIDLLAPRSNLSRIEQTLLTLGYTPLSDNEGQAEIYGHLVYMPPTEGVRVEFHWSIARPGDPFRVDVEGLWQRARSAIIANTATWVLSPEDLLLHLCIHASYQHHFLTGLRPLCDVSEIIWRCGDELNWDEVQHRARQWGAGNCVYLTLTLTQKLLGTPIPQTVLQGLAPDDMTERISHWAEARILSRVAVNQEDWSRGWGTFRASEGLSAKASVFLKTFFPPPSTVARIYSLPAHSKRVYLYYPVRVAGLLRRHAPRVWRLLRRHQDTMAWAEQEEAKAGLLKWLAAA